MASEEVISFGFPLPLRLMTWFLNAFGDKIPSIIKQSLDQLIQALETGTSLENPLHIGLDDRENGERVQLIIG